MKKEKTSHRCFIWWDFNDIVECVLKSAPTLPIMPVTSIQKETEQRDTTPRYFFVDKGIGPLRNQEVEKHFQTRKRKYIILSFHD
jgi:hypothetical protein